MSACRSRAEVEGGARDVLIAPLDVEHVLADLGDLVRDGVGSVGRLFHAQFHFRLTAWGDHPDCQQSVTCAHTHTVHGMCTFLAEDDVTRENKTCCH